MGGPLGGFSEVDLEVSWRSLWVVLGNRFEVFGEFLRGRSGVRRGLLRSIWTAVAIPNKTKIGVLVHTRHKSSKTLLARKTLVQIASATLKIANTNTTYGLSFILWLQLSQLQNTCKT